MRLHSPLGDAAAESCEAARPEEVSRLGAPEKLKLELDPSLSFLLFSPLPQIPILSFNIHTISLIMLLSQFGCEQPSFLPALLFSILLFSPLHHWYTHRPTPTRTEPLPRPKFVYTHTHPFAAHILPILHLRGAQHSTDTPLPLKHLHLDSQMKSERVRVSVYADCGTGMTAHP